ncbi:hypothetical protein BKP45_07835 [Anaerobacillus alkalidiazotrophicus]|uniref:Uncharacterized protein n=1 Tax=Anaerobacillus alkalidiazotrophicus TaxID=472963 RepID=A0A1S2M7S6_9BACI|nr:hypothetical protein [Anaerobacillus alkalidiazotrophicus]OIJ20872.1 hypothetical protein BKP45_07835 [Anaerobacillus alkalidiazotrophicus]
MKKNIQIIMLGIGTFVSYSFLLDLDFLRKAVALWYMEDSKGMIMLLVSKGSSQSYLAFSLLYIESFFFPFHTLFMNQVVNELYGFIHGSFYFIGMMIFCIFPFYLISRNELKFEPLVVFMFSLFLLPIPIVAFTLVYIVQNKELLRGNFSAKR